MNASRLVLKIFIIIFIAGFTKAEADERAICTNSAKQINPAISGSKIVWLDDRKYEYNWEIYLYDLDTRVETMLITPYMSISGYPLNISGNKIVWENHRDDKAGIVNPDIYLYNLDTGVETPLCTGSWYQRYPAISGNKIVWQDDRNGGRDMNYDIYLYDLDREVEIPICTELRHQYYPAIDGNKIVWADKRNELNGRYYDIYLYDLDTGIETPICTSPGNQSFPAISGNKIVWVDTGYDDDRNSIYLYDLETKEEIAIRQTSSGAKGLISKPAISENKIVWDDYRNGQENADIYLYNIDTGVETPICNSQGNQIHPKISGNKIVWQDYRNGYYESDIYLYELEDSPVTTTINGDTSTTTICEENDLCCTERIYGEHTTQTELLRYFRDNVLSKTQEGRALIRLYYQGSPTIVRAMKEDDKFKEWVKTIIDSVLPMIGGEME